NGGHDLSRGPGAHDGLLDIRVALDIDHGPKAAGYQDGGVIRGIHFGQLATMIEPAKGLSLKKSLLGGVFLVVRVVGCPSAGGRGELDCDPCLVKYVEGMRDLREK